jgi:oligopeptide transport system substrate-binding protein
VENGKWKVENSGKPKFQVSIAGRPLGVCVVLLALLFSACNQLKKPETEPFYAQNPPPPKQEFRWSNGKMPKSFDPAKAAASPETDFVRALYEGLTDTDSKTLQPVPAIAVKWTPSEDFKTWTFTLRRDAKWSNGETITAKDFVRSWKRLVELGEKVPQRALLKNIVGMDTENVLPVFAEEEIDILSSETPTVANFLNNKKPANNNSIGDEAKNGDKKTDSAKSGAGKPEQKTTKEIKKDDRFGVEAVDDFTLKISLTQPDKNFASLVSHPVFRPVHDGGRNFENGGLDAGIVTSGAFRVSSIESDKVVLDRAEHFWNANETRLERVRFVATENAENALEAYRAGEVDAVTNVDFKPLALKLLAPYDDFRRTTHSALNFYEFNQSKPQFADARVRKALAMAIERERLTEDEMDGASRPALKFSPFSEDDKLSQDIVEAQKLLAEAGFPLGKDFPVIQLLVNRNDTQRRIANSVKKMWKKNLNIETEVMLKDQADFEAAYQNGEYDVVRRGVVLPTTDETANMLALFPTNSEPVKEDVKATSDANAATDNQILNEKSAESNLNLAVQENSFEEKKENLKSVTEERKPLLTEQQALNALPAIPLYFPTSYSLVKPYVQGFETNALDAPSLKNVRIDNAWQPTNQKFLSNNQK